jgi:hypothetical protein
VLMLVGFAVAGPVAHAVGLRETLIAIGFIAVVLSVVLAAVPSVRAVRRVEPDAAVPA